MHNRSGSYNTVRRIKMKIFQINRCYANVTRNGNLYNTGVKNSLSPFFN